MLDGVRNFVGSSAHCQRSFADVQDMLVHSQPKSTSAGFGLRVRKGVIW